MIVEKSYAKINLVLNITDKLNNGYHLLDSIMASIDFYDTLYIEESDKDELICNESIEGENIISKTINYIRNLYDIKNKYVKVTLNKNIYIAAGLAGGSGNASAIIRGLNKLWNLNMNNKDMNNIAKNIGADVTYCLYNKLARAKGIGEELTFIENNIKEDIYCLLINPNFKINTKDAFEKIDSFNKEYSKKSIKNDLVEQAFINGSFIDIINNLENDFEKVAFSTHDELYNLKQEIDNSFDCDIKMSGSGPTLFLLSQSKEKLLNIKNKYINIYKTEVFKLLK